MNDDAYISKSVETPDGRWRVEIEVLEGEVSVEFYEYENEDEP